VGALALSVQASAGCRASGRNGSPAPDASPAARIDAPAEVSAAGEAFLLYRWSFDTAKASFGLVDLAMHGSLVEALGTEGRIAINAGFFDPEGRAIGLAVSQGKVLSDFSKTMSGGVFYIVDAVARVDATEEFDPTRRVDLAVQCRPRLVVGGQANVRSDDGQRAERTALCVRDAGRTVDVVLAEPRAGSRGPSLFALAQYLAAGEPRCEDALNLDGGPSTGVAYRGGDATMSMEVMPPRGPLRYALVMRDR
jgi:uncharacterized protein YigE (DUF2233 family)